MFLVIVESIISKVFLFQEKQKSVSQLHYNQLKFVMRSSKAKECVTNTNIFKHTSILFLNAALLKLPYKNKFYRKRCLKYFRDVILELFVKQSVL